MKLFFSITLISFVNINAYAEQDCACLLSKDFVKKMKQNCEEPILKCQYQTSPVSFNGNKEWFFVDTYEITCEYTTGIEWMSFDCNTGEVLDSMNSVNPYYFYY